MSCASRREDARDFHAHLRALIRGERLFKVRDLHLEPRDFVFDRALPVFHLAQLDGIQPPQPVVLSRGGFRAGAAFATTACGAPAVFAAGRACTGMPPPFFRHR